MNNNSPPPLLPLEIRNILSLCHTLLPLDIPGRVGLGRHAQRLVEISIAHGFAAVVGRLEARQDATGRAVGTALRLQLLQHPSYLDDSLAHAQKVRRA